MMSKVSIRELQDRSFDSLDDSLALGIFEVNEGVYLRGGGSKSRTAHNGIAEWVHLIHQILIANAVVERNRAVILSRSGFIDYRFRNYPKHPLDIRVRIPAHSPKRPNVPRLRVTIKLRRVRKMSADREERGIINRTGEKTRAGISSRITHLFS